jgi:hypothetical protein
MSFGMDKFEDLPDYAKCAWVQRKSAWDKETETMP